MTYFRYHKVVSRNRRYHSKNHLKLRSFSVTKNSALLILLGGGSTFLVFSITNLRKFVTFLKEWDYTQIKKSTEFFYIFISYYYFKNCPNV